MTTTHDYKYNKEASDDTKIVTICSHCGDVKVKLTANEVDQMDLWTKPPIHFMPTRRTKFIAPSVMSVSPRRFD